MKTMKRVSAVMAAAALIFTAAACSGGAEKKTDADAPKEEQQSEKAEDLQRADADLVIWCDNDRAPIIQKYAEEFAKERGLKAAIQVSGDVRKQFETASKVGKGPDIIIGAHDWLGGFVQNGMVKPLSVGDGILSKFSDTAVTGAKYEGKVYGLPYAVENIALIRNKALAPEAPKSIDEMLAHGKALQDQGKTDRVLIQEVSKSGNAYYAYPYLSAYKGGIFAVKDGQFDSTQVIVDSPESKMGAELLAKLGKEGVLSTNISGDNANALFAEGVLHT
ncbi:extracellular solute-binding protein [Arcanobacterium hippocoleae]